MATSHASTDVSLRPKARLAARSRCHSARGMVNTRKMARAAMLAALKYEISASITAPSPASVSE